MKRKTVKKELKVKTVTYAKLSNTGNFENERLEATAEVGTQDPDVVFFKLKQWVDQKLCDC